MRGRKLRNKVVASRVKSVFPGLLFACLRDRRLSLWQDVIIYHFTKFGQQWQLLLYR